MPPFNFVFAEVSSEFCCLGQRAQPKAEDNIGGCMAFYIE